jgi:uncharacterized protein (TIGR02453 family)
MIKQQVLDFLKDLKENNNKEWFETHRKAYENAKKNIIDFTAELIKNYALIDPTIAHLQPKDCLFRINRDVRFSADKSPYKTNMGISVSKGAKKLNLAGYYIHLQPNECFVAGGMYMPMPPELKKIREEIDYNFDKFQTILENPTFKQMYGNLVKENLSLSRVPKGYEADNPAAEFLKLKGFIATQKLTDAEVLSDDFVEEISEKMRALQPLITFLNHALEETS